MFEIGDVVTYMCQFSQKQTIGHVIGLTSSFGKPAYIVKDKKFNMIVPATAKSQTLNSL